MKTYDIDVDCAACALKMENAARNTNGVKDAQVSFMTLKMKVDFADVAYLKSVLKQVLKTCQKVENDCDIYI